MDVLNENQHIYLQGIITGWQIDYINLCLNSQTEETHDYMKELPEELLIPSASLRLLNSVGQGTVSVQHTVCMSSLSLPVLTTSAVQIHCLVLAYAVGN